jgi:M6 family metalloprotease-like protein
MIHPDSGWYVYADNHGGVAVPTDYAAGVADPESSGIPAWTEAPREAAGAVRSQVLKALSRDGIQPAPTTGTINNIVIFVRFNGDSEFGEPISKYETMFNSAGQASLYSYYREASYNQLSISTTFYPPPSGGSVVSWKDSNSRGYYRPYNSSSNPSGYSTDNQRYSREQALVKNAIEAANAYIPSGLNVDGDGDGVVDGISVIIKGQPDGWQDLLWPHAWQMYAYSVYVNGKRVDTFAFEIQSVTDVSTLAHETFHTLGAPDLYHYNFDGIYPVWKWDVLEYAEATPEHMSAYSKWRWGKWISSIPVISDNGTYTLSPVTSSTNAYRIKSPNSTSEYFIVEYRRKTGMFESAVPGSGLVVYRINSNYDNQGNGNGPPDEVYVYRPGGTRTSNGNPDLAFFSSDSGRTIINDSTDPKSFLSGGGAGGLHVYNVGPPGATITFKVGTTCLCTGKECGDDSCGGSCGTCSTTQTCMVSTCNASFKCVVSAAPSTAPCSDGNACTSGDHCNGSGVCLGGTPYSCTPGECEETVECDGKGGCKATAYKGTETLCNDGDTCTRDDRCDGQGGCTGFGYECSPGQCESSSICDGKGGCVAANKPSTSFCSTGDKCSTGDHCDGKGKCVSGGVSPSCQDGGVKADGGGGGGMDGGSGGGGSDGGGGGCACDETTSCDPDCACDPECACDCDQNYGCDPDCPCDQECKPDRPWYSCSCSSVGF